MPEYVLALGAEEDLVGIAEYTVARWGVGQAQEYAAVLEAHFEALGAGQVMTKAVFDHWAELEVSRCQHHYVFSLRRERAPVAVLAVFHESMDLPARLRERLGAEN